MADVILDLTQPVPLDQDEDQETLEAIDRGIEDADAGRTFSIEEVREMLPKWISESRSRNQR